MAPNNKNSLKDFCMTYMEIQLYCEIVTRIDSKYTLWQCNEYAGKDGSLNEYCTNGWRKEVLTSRRRKSTGVNNKLKEDLNLFSCFIFRVRAG